MKIAKEGFWFIFVPILVAIVFYLLHIKIIFVLSLLIAAFMAFFFRIPKRVQPSNPKAIVAPADGKLVDIAEDGEWLKVAIFLSPLDVHVNWIPYDGEVIDVKYISGKHLQAFRPLAATENERIVTMVRTKNGIYKLAQIAGIMARRVVCHLKPGDKVKRGQVFGMIKFGSRTELFLPADRVQIAVQTGEKVRGGETVIAYFKEF